MVSRKVATPLVMIIAGGTGGHVFPGLAVAQRLRERRANVVWMGSTKGLENEYVPKAGIEMDTVDVEGLRRRGVLPWLLLPWRLSRALLQTLRILLKRKPQVVLGFGGFTAGPGGLMAAALGIPLLIHEQNSIAGLTNKWLALLSHQVLLGFPDVIKRRNARWVGNPVRAEIAALPAPAERFKSRDEVLRLLVIGGSRGAVVFNNVVPQAIAECAVRNRLLVRQQTGRGKLTAAHENVARAGVEVECLEFIDDVASMYAWADVVLCRAGALSVAEIAAAGVAAVLVPYPFSVDDHQAQNARFLALNDAAIVVAEDEFVPHMFARLLEHLVNAREELLKLAVNARKLAQPQADTLVADMCIKASGKSW